jgi:hypothetical protein
LRLLGYPLDPEGEHMMRLEIQAARAVEIVGHMPAKSVRVVRRKVEVRRRQSAASARRADGARGQDVTAEFEQKRRLGQLLEQLGLLVRPRKLSRAARLARRTAQGRAQGGEPEESGGEDEDEAAEGGKPGEADEEDEDEEPLIVIGGTGARLSAAGQRED